MRAIFCLLAVMLTGLRCVAQAANTASVEGVVMAGRSDPIAGAKVELHSQMRTFGGETDRTGHYQFEGVTAGEYLFQVRSAGFKTYEIKSIQIAAGQRLRIPDTALRVGDLCGLPLPRESARMLPGLPDLGTLIGSVYLSAPFLALSPFTRTTVTLVCDAGRVCRSTRTNLLGKFEFRDLPTGWYDVRVSRSGFYPEEEKELPVSAGLEQVYFPFWLDKCPHGNCDPKVRPVKNCVN